MKRTAASVLKALHRAEDWLLTLIVVALVLIAGGQIVLRLLFEGGVPWADTLLRTMVLWVAMLGAMAATREGKHIGLDVAARLLKGPALRISRLVSQGFAAAICALLAWYCAQLVLIEFADGTELYGVPVWLAQSILPLGFGVMALRFVVQAFVLPPLEDSD